MIQIHCRGEVLELSYKKELSLRENLFEHYGWLLKPIMVKEGSFENALQKLNWKITYANS
jgi:hypothetical protein